MINYAIEWLNVMFKKLVDLSQGVKRKNEHGWNMKCTHCRKTCLSGQQQYLPPSLNTDHCIAKYINSRTDQNNSISVVTDKSTDDTDHYI